ncbi:MAG: hypothetical protein PHS74_00530 [Lachnospiraceae bacterium]|nr:hypothetical protein [Lachnospiraceae bacterium]
MLRNGHLMILKDDSEVDSITKLAANHQLQCLYKIGVYGKEKQHELYIIGHFWNYSKFMKELSPKRKK